jgi:hypothetical protein
MNVVGRACAPPGPMLIKAYHIESRRHGSIDFQPVLMGIVHLKEGVARGQLCQLERVAVNLVMDHSPFSHDVMQGRRRGKRNWPVLMANCLEFRPLKIP